MSKHRADFIASRNVLAANIALFHHGHRDVYRVVAVELRKLLCDQPCLVQRLFDDPRLHPTRLYRPGEDLSGLVVQVPAAIHMTENGPVVLEVFQKTRTPIPLQEWLAQPLLSEVVTVRELIKSVADKEAAHSDPVYNEALLLARSVHIGDGQELLGLFIVAIGEYILDMCDRAITASPHVFPVRVV